MPTIISPAAKKAFEVFDIDKSGAIDQEEMVQILTRGTPAGTPLSLEEAKEVIADFDKSGTGELNVSGSAVIESRTGITHAIGWRALPARGEMHCPPSSPPPPHPTATDDACTVVTA